MKFLNLWVYQPFYFPFKTIIFFLCRCSLYLMRGSTQEKYLEAKLQDITRTEGRDVTTPDLYVEVNYLIPGTEEISEKVIGRHTRLNSYLTHLSLSCSVSCQVIERLHFATVSDCLELH